MRTYASRLSILSATLALMWVFGLSTFYLSLAVVYGRFTWYFLWPTLLLSVMTGIYLSQIVETLMKLKRASNTQVELHSGKLYFFVTVLEIPFVYFFEQILLSNTLSTLLSGCIWLPQILKNARYGNRNTPKLRHAILLQATISWLTIYIKFNATSIFNLQPQDGFSIFYFGLIVFQIWVMFI